MSGLDRAIRSLDTIGLEAYDDRAALRTRVDRKYLLPEALVEELIAETVDEIRVLEIDGRRRHRYRSLYFDTEDRQLHRAAAQNRRPRYKVRSRSYASGEHWTEIKLRSRRQERTKLRTPTRDAERLDHVDVAFLAAHIEASSIERLRPVLRTSYERTSLVHLEPVERCTIDSDVRCSLLDGTTVGVAMTVLETKSAGHPTHVDRWLWRRGHRPVAFSKYTTALAALEPGLPANKWHRVLGTCFG